MTDQAMLEQEELPPDYSVLTLDRSRPFSTVHGDRQPGDPHYNVHFWQGGLPFDVSGNLIPPKPDQRSVRGEDADGNVVMFHPLYNDQSMKALAAKMKRLRSVKTLEPEPITSDSEPEERERASEDVNLEAWLRGKVQYEPFLIYAACKSRFGRNYSRLGTVVEELVYDEKLVDESEVAPGLLALLDKPAA